MTMFQTAMIRAGGGWVGVIGEDAISMSKGESLEDTIREYGSFADCIVMRHSDDDSAERAAEISFVPILNGGSGSREHGIAAPYFICMLAYYLKRPLEGIKVGIYGTPGINRATKSLVSALGIYGATIIIDDLGHFPLPKEVEDAAMANGLNSIKYDKLENFIDTVDVLFLTRGLQKGIISSDTFSKEKEEMILERYKPITKKHMEKMRKDSILFMIKPRIFEVEKEVDSDSRACYSKQEPYAEMALALITYYLEINV